VTDRPPAPGPREGPEDSRAEQVLAQALNLMAGGGKSPAPPTNAEKTAGTGRSTRRLTTGQLILLAAVVGLLVGIAAGFLSLMF